MKKYIPYFVCFLLLAVFCCGIYGPVFRHLAEENYVSADAEAMSFVLSEPLGKLYVVARYLMLPLQFGVWGGVYLALLLTLLTVLADKALHLSAKASGAGVLVPVMLLSWAVSRGYNLFMRNEPSRLVLYIYLGIVIFSFVAVLVKAYVHVSEFLNVKYAFGWVLAVLSVGGVSVYASVCRQNVILSCDMQNKLLEANWEGMVQDALKARHPDRSVAAYHAIALNQQGRLLENMFEIDYSFHQPELDDKGGMDEGENYMAECNLFTCLPQPAYHYALCQQVVEGPRLRWLKLLVICSVLQQEDALCRKYLSVLEKMPFQHDFVATWLARLDTPTLTSEDPTMARILEQVSFEEGFENDYSKPLFIGFNAGVKRATPETLKASMAAALYTKDVENILFRARYLQRIEEILPAYVQEALVLATARHPELLQQFPSVSNTVKMRASVFANLADPYLKTEDFAAAHDALFSEWGDSYFYYYAFGNRNPWQQEGKSTGVN